MGSFTAAYILPLHVIQIKSPVFQVLYAAGLAADQQGFQLQIGKGNKFWRPVIILQKHNRDTFFGLPMGSSHKPGHRYYHPIEFRGRPGSVLLSQGRTLSAKRLSNLMGSLSENKFNNVKNAFLDNLKN